MSRSRCSRLLAILAVFLLCFVHATPARADGGAAALKQQGDDAMLSGRPAEALEAYTKAYELAPNPALRYNRGRALQALTRFPEALDELEAFKADAPPALKSRVTGLDDLLVELRGRISTLTVACDVPGATVRLRDRTLGTTPLVPTRVNSGRARLEVIAEGFFPFVRDIELRGGQEDRVVTGLIAKNRFALLGVTTTKPGATILLDQKAIGQAPLETSVLAGTHRIDATLDGHKPASTSVVLAVGAEKRITLDLQKEPGILSRWWFWTAVGGVVVAGASVITYVALTTEKDPSQGTFGPGIVTTN